jgi:hypothetical protein
VLYGDANLDVDKIKNPLASADRTDPAALP